MSSGDFAARMIWITPKFPLGAPDGARHATSQLLRDLFEQNVAIDLVCLTQAGDVTDHVAVKSRLGVRSCASIPRSRSRFLPWPQWGIPFTFRSFTDPRVRTLLKQHLASLMTSHSGDLGEQPFIVFDGLHTFGALRPEDVMSLDRSARGLIYRAHNFETALWEQCVERSGTPWTRAFFRHQADLVRRFECEIVQRATWTAAVSEEDVDRFKSLVPGAAVGSTPIGMNFPDDKEIPHVREGAPFELLFVGRLDWLPNREGLRWFLNNVWLDLKVRQPQITLNIVGTGDGRWLRSYQNQPGLKLLGPVPDLAPLYESCVLTLAPIFQGSGTRVKILEAARYKRAVLTTPLGSEGTNLVPGVSCFHAETPADWISTLEQLTLHDCRRVGENAAIAIRKRFDGKIIAAQLLKRLLTQTPAETREGVTHGL